MADSVKSPQPSNTPSPDFIIARKTLRFLGRELRTEQFVLKGCIKRRKEYERGETEARIRILKLKERIQQELDMNPGIFGGAIGEED